MTADFGSPLSMAGADEDDMFAPTGNSSSPFDNSGAADYSFDEKQGADSAAPIGVAHGANLSVTLEEFHMGSPLPTQEETGQGTSTTQSASPVHSVDAMDVASTAFAAEPSPLPSPDSKSFASREDDET